MPQTITRIALLAALIFSAGCSSDDKAEPDRRFMSFQMDGKILLSEQRNMVSNQLGNTTDSDPINDNASMLIQAYTAGKDAINIHIRGNGPTITPGVYSNNQPGNAFTMEEFVSMDLLLADETTGALNVIIHQVKDDLVIGEFLGTVVSQDLGTVHNISRGYFKLKYQTSIAPAMP